MAQPFRILLVDDDDVIRRVLLAVFARVAEARAVGTADEARAALEAFPADLVLCDDAMPGEQGSALLVELARTHPATQRVLFSAAEPEDLAALLRDGVVHAYVQKPASVDELLALVVKAP